ncbi:CPBP family intramembrane glutamic endopeptidase [Aliikangiella sp. G2MR2-5]|uniref:CPBP family intramembrane glutamic endopeptidase n=1 Tax=Aliikangiella sp. G2MR2-5 TaxID=2788943 RepID=UPI0018ABA475|nr:type II CAAX endopeptidase family protein [Aliikangiella sp. G2MR2-5]
MLENTIEKPSIFCNAYSLKRRNKLFLLPILTFIFIIFGQGLSIAPAIESQLFTPEQVEVYPYILYFLLITFPSILVLLILWVKFYEGRNLESLGLGLSRASTKHLINGATCGLFMAMAIVASILLLGGYKLGNNAPFTLSSIVPPLLLLAGFLVQSWSEEVLFRGWLLSRFFELKGQGFAILASSLMFILVHLLSFDFNEFSLSNFVIFFLMTLLFSSFLAMMTIHYQSIWFAAAWHGLWNWFFINGSGLPTTGISLDIRPLFLNLDSVVTAPIWLTGGIDGPENSVVTILVLAVANLYSYKLISKTR